MQIQILVTHESGIEVPTPEDWWAKSDWEHMEEQDGKEAGRANNLVNIIFEACKAAGFEVDVKPYPERSDL
jgi:flavodoxin